MNFLTKLFQKITALLLGKKREPDLTEAIKVKYPDALYIKDIFPASTLNIEFVVLPSVADGGLPDDLKEVIQRKDGYVTVVFTGETAVAVAALKDDPASVAEILTDKLLSMTTIDETIVKVLDQLTEAYNKIIPGKKLAEDALMKKLLGMAAALMKRSETFASAKELYAALLSTVLVNGHVQIELPEKLEGKLAKLGLAKLAEKNETAALAVKMLEGQINNILEAVLKNLKGDVVVV
jgi:hypothetical protein